MAVKLTQEMIAGAQATERKYGVPASITLGQIMLESGGSYEGGLSGLAVKGKNLFGIKGTGTAGSITMNTKEQGKNGMYVTSAQFRKYNNFAESIDDHGKLLTGKRYTDYTQNAKTVEEYAHAIHKAGYATDANYANKLINIINSNNLKQYDGGGVYPNRYTGGLTLQNAMGKDKPSGGTVNGTISADDLQAGYAAAGVDTELDMTGQILRFIVILLLLILAVVFFMKAFDISMPSVPSVKGVLKTNE